MPRKRMIDPMVWDDPDLISLTPAERLLFIGFVSLADDYGHLTANPSMLRKWVFGYDDSVKTTHVEAMRDHLLTACHNVHLYRVGSQDYLWLSAWERRQDLRFRGPAQYPCHACAGYHKNKDDWEPCKGQPVKSELLTQDLRSACVELPQDLPPCSVTLRSDELRSITPPAGGAKSATPTPTYPQVMHNAAKAPKDEADAARRAVFMAVLNGCGYDRLHLTKSEQGELNAAAKQLCEAHYMAADVGTMVGNWYGHMEDCIMTPSALAKHASRLMHPLAENSSKASVNDWAGVNHRNKEMATKAGIKRAEVLT